ncbi:hypothetical protein ACFVTY_29635 [Streptomyces sp. NPDC058067]|uniref:hypothetical protein n=1 Tax=Streptomyces sp. NPDC058067 TaxID=3346324 RepID=UPI0036F0E908
MGIEMVHRAYSFVCLSCGHTWEAEYDIRLTTEDHDHLRAEYFLDGRRVHSPLNESRCPNCEHTHIRILSTEHVNSAHLPTD